LKKSNPQYRNQQKTKQTLTKTSPKTSNPQVFKKNPQIHKKQAQIRAKTARLATLVSGKPGQQLVSDERICVCLSLCVYCI